MFHRRWNRPRLNFHDAKPALAAVATSESRVKATARRKEGTGVFLICTGVIVAKEMGRRRYGDLRMTSIVSFSNLARASVSGNVSSVTPIARK